MGNGEEVSGRSGVIDVVLHEYDSLRAEILARSDARFQLIGYLGIAATLLGTQISEGARGWLIGIALGSFIVIWLRFGFLIKKCANRLLEIEAEVNKELHTTALVWETRQPRGLLYRGIR
jgi:hypothetical protein